MKIESIKVTNFKGVASKSVSFKDGRVTVLVGPNGMGKTSFIEALQWGLTGVLPQNPINDNANEATVEIVLADGTEFSRTVYRDGKPSKVIVDGRITPAKNLNALIKEYFGFGTDVLKIATSADVLASMKSEDLGEFLLRYVPEKLDATKVLGFIAEPTVEMQEAVLLSLPDEKFDISDIEKVYEDFVENRKNAKKDLAFTEGKIARLPESKPSKSPGEIQEKLENLLKREGAAKTARDALRVYEDTKKKREQALRNVDELQREFDSISATRPNPVMREDYQKQLLSAQKKNKEAENMINIMRNTIKTLNATLERLSTNHCPLSDRLICTTDKTKVRGEILATVASNNDGINIQRQIVDETNKEIEKLGFAIKEFDDNSFAYKKKILIGEQLEKAKNNVPELLPRPSVIEESDFEKEKEILKAELDYAQKWEEREKLEKQKAKEENLVSLYESLCKSFAPRGEVMTRILASYLSFFEDEINKRANSLRTGMNISFVSENGVKYLIKMKGEKEFHLYEELSKGEKTLAIFLLLDLVSALCGTKIMMLDDLNNLDASALEEIIALTTTPEFIGAYDNILLSSVNNEDVMNVVKKYETVIHII